MVRSGYEFYVGQDLGKSLVTVNLVSGVREPGVYHVPFDTDLAQLLAYAGGPVDSSNLDEILVRRNNGEKIQLFSQDLRKSFEDPGPLFVIQDRDMIHIPTRTTFDNSLKWLTLLSTIVSIGLSAALINDMNRR